MAPRANWKGYLKLSLVSCPVALYPAASSSERVSFHLINSETHNRLKQQYVDSVTGELVETSDRMRGYEIAKGEYVPVTDEELADVALESTHTIEIEQFAPRSEVDEVFYDSHYFIAPDDKVGEEAFAVIREAMKKRNVVGLARVVLFRRERILMIEPRGKGLMATTLRYDYEVRSEDAYFEEIEDAPVAKEMLDLANHIIDTKKGKFDPATFKDRYQDAVVELIRAKRAGKPIEAPRPAKSGNVINLMDALRRSVEAESKDERESKPAQARPSARRATKRATPAPATTPPAQRGGKSAAKGATKSTARKRKAS
ncbi:MAG: Ku protein [Hyphomicrobiales bacterium]|jgi:DNA end-binding protein Ku|nr:Ku protein [Hyphomicrobiales bacterium]